MKTSAFLLCAAVSLGGCTTNSSNVHKDPTGESTLNLCRILATNPDQAYRTEVAKLLVRRGASAEKCTKLVTADNDVATAIAIGGAAAAAGAMAANNGYGGGGYYPQNYGVAWDQFYNQYYQLIWRCRDRATGRFVYDSHCSSKPMNDFTWPGWSA